MIFQKKNSLKNIKKLFYDISKHVDPGALILLETTIPPGTSRKILFPILNRILKKRNISSNSIYFGYSFERIMPGDNYINSINDNFRAYSGINKISSKNSFIFEKFYKYKKIPTL